MFLVEYSENTPDEQYLGEKRLVRVFSRKKRSSGWNPEGDLTTAKPVRQGDRMFLINLETDRLINTSPVEDARWDGDTLLVSTMNSEYSLQPIEPREPSAPREVAYVAEGVSKAAKSMLGMLGF